jgi:hypothetical protein
MITKLKILLWRLNLLSAAAVIMISDDTNWFYYMLNTAIAESIQLQFSNY